MLHIYQHTLFWSPAEADSGKIINSTSEVLRCFHSRPPPSLPSVLTSGADNITAEVTGPTCTPAHLHTAQDSELAAAHPIASAALVTAIMAHCKINLCLYYEISIF